MASRRDTEQPTRTRNRPAAPGRRRSVIGALWHRRRWVVLPMAAAAAGVGLWAGLATPLYKSTAEIAIERNGGDGGADSAGRIQLVGSRDLARQVIGRLGLQDTPEFAPESGALRPARLLAMLGAARDRGRLPAEDQVIERFQERLSARGGSRANTIAVTFVSAEPERAARAANAVAEAYVGMQHSARPALRQADGVLAAEIAAQRQRVRQAEQRLEAQRDEAGKAPEADTLAQNETGTDAELDALRAELAEVRAERTASQTRARLVEGLLEDGAALEVSEIIDSPVIQTLGEEKARVQARIAELSATLGPRHPRMVALEAELADLRVQAGEEAERIVRAAKTEARVAAEREAELRAAIEQRESEIGPVEPESQLPGLERELRAQRELLTDLRSRAGDGGANGGAPAARIVARAVPAQAPFYPRPLPVLLAAVLAAGLIGAAGALLVERWRRPPAASLGPPRSVATPAASLAARLEIPRPGAAGGAKPAGGAQGLEAIAGAVAAQPPGTQSGARVVLVTSQRRLREVADVATELARRVAGDGRRVVLVDSRFNEPIPALRDAALRGSLSELVAGRCAFDSALVRDPASRVHMVPAGKTEGGPLAVVSSDRMEMVLEALAATYDVVVLLAPPLTRKAELRAVAGRADLAVLGARAGAGEAANREARDALSEIGIDTVAVVTIDDAPDDAEGPDRKAA